MSPTARRPRHNPIADDGDELRFCSTCAFSDACLSQGYNKSDLMDLHVLVEHIGPFHEGEHIFREGDEFNAIAAVRAGTVKTYVLDAAGQQALDFDDLMLEREGRRSEAGAQRQSRKDVLLHGTLLLDPGR